MIGIARPYAKAAFAYAHTHHAIEAWSDFFQQLAQLLKQKAIAENIRDPRISRERWAEILMAIDGDQFTAPQQRFLRLLVERRRLAALPQIAELFEEERARVERRLTVRVISALPIDEVEESKLIELLKKKFQQQIELVCQIDPTLIGGVILHVNGAVLDASLRGYLHELVTILNE